MSCVHIDTRQHRSQPYAETLTGYVAGRAFRTKVSKRCCLDRHTIRTQKRWTLLTISASDLLWGESRRPKRRAGCCSIDRSYKTASLYPFFFFYVLRAPPFPFFLNKRPES